jgi:hypothetical protein
MSASPVIEGMCFVKHRGSIESKHAAEGLASPALYFRCPLPLCLLHFGSTILLSSPLRFVQRCCPSFFDIAHDPSFCDVAHWLSFCSISSFLPLFNILNFVMLSRFCSGHSGSTLCHCPRRQAYHYDRQPEVPTGLRQVQDSRAGAYQLRREEGTRDPQRDDWWAWSRCRHRGSWVPLLQELDACHRDDANDGDGPQRDAERDDCVRAEGEAVLQSRPSLRSMQTISSNRPPVVADPSA